jgi:hypothetical protein
MRRRALLGLATLGALSLGIAFALAQPKQTPTNDQNTAFKLGVPYTTFNTRTAHGLERGCNACHGDHLADAVNNLIVPRSAPELHGNFSTSYGIPMRVEDCLICHGKAFAGDMHSVHLHSKAFVALQGSCDSCHAMQNGQFVLYDDESRYKVLNGISRSSPTPPFSQP